MRVNRFLAVAAALFIAALPASADQILGPGRIDNSGRLMLPGGPKLGTYQNGKFTSQPDAIDTTGLKVLSLGDAPAPISYAFPQLLNDFYSRTIIRNPGRGQHVGKSISDLSIYHEADGSGANGPFSSDQAAVFSVTKKGYPSTSSATGEIDAVNVFCRQSGAQATSDTAASDMNCISGNYAMAGYPGYAAWMEFRALQQDATAPYTVNLDGGSQIGVIDPFGGNITGNRYANVNLRSWMFGAVASKGAWDRAFFAAQSSLGYFNEFARLELSGVPQLRIFGGLGADAGTMAWGPDASKLTLGLDSGALTIKDAQGNVTARFYQGAQTFLQALVTSSVSVNGTPMLTSRQTVVYPPLATVPTNPVQGETYFDASLKKLRTWDGTTWQALW
jgi:hypothetical protein